MNIRTSLLVPALAITLALSACDRYIHTPQCSDMLANEPFPSNMVLDNKGSVLDTETGLRWYRCSAGMRFSNGQCIGEAILLSQPDAMTYAAEFSARANQAWRLPSAKEMQSLTLSNCLNPVLHPEVFPSILVDNYWTASVSPSSPGMGCTLYTFNGNGHCREVRTQAHPFLLVLGKP